MATETKNCQNCKQDFVIEPDDFAFYEKIKVPAPTWCPDCRMQRRMAFRNERTLYKRNCDKCKKTVISAYPSKSHLTIYCLDCWYSDSWDPMDYGMDYDEKKPFFEQWKELQNKVPRGHVNNQVGEMFNSEYTNCASELKNCYLVYGAVRDEDCGYSHYLNDSRQCFDNLYSIKNENCYDCLDIHGCFGVMHSQSCMNCRDSYFLFDCRNCSDCIGCVGLRNKNYYIFNQPYTKEEYFKKKEELNLKSRAGLKRVQDQYMKELYYKSPRKYYHGQMNTDFSGDYISNTENTHQSFYIKNTRGCKFVFWCNNAKDVYDYMSWGDMEFSYECVSNGYNSYNCRFCDASWTENKNLEYCSLSQSSSDLFGCIGLRKKQYCILNKQYSEEKYKSLREKIIKEMSENQYKDARGIAYPYGEFVPIELSPFLYKDTVAQEHFPMTDEEIKKSGFRWQEPEARSYKTTITAENLPDSINEVQDSILEEVVGCLHNSECVHQCTEAFKITLAELQFYRKMNIPLPQLCYNCRHAGRVALRNPLKLWQRSCECGGKKSQKGDYQNLADHFHADDKCPNKFESAYALERSEIVYCEQCYNAEVV